jgi:hypothetical protein
MNASSAVALNSKGASHAKRQNGPRYRSRFSGQEQPADKDRAQTANETESGHMPPQPGKKDELQPLKEKSGC